MIAVSVLIWNPVSGAIEADTEPLTIWYRLNPVTPLAGTLYKPVPSPINEPVKKDAVTLSVR